jgi:hypothetical protein
MYTKGEWSVFDWHTRIEVLCGGRVVASLDESDFTLNEDEANAHLIAAAPELYKELVEADRVICELCYIVNPQHATADYGVGCKSCEDRDRRLVAIGKAEGK